MILSSLTMSSYKSSTPKTYSKMSFGLFLLIAYVSLELELFYFSIVSFDASTKSSSLEFFEQL